MRYSRIWQLGGIALRFFSLMSETLVRTCLNYYCFTAIHHDRAYVTIGVRKDLYDQTRMVSETRNSGFCAHDADIHLCCAVVVASTYTTYRDVHVHQRIRTLLSGLWSFQIVFTKTMGGFSMSSLSSNSCTIVLVAGATATATAVAVVARGLGGITS